MLSLSISTIVSYQQFAVSQICRFYVWHARHLTSVHAFMPLLLQFYVWFVLKTLNSRCGSLKMSHHSDDNMLIATSDSFWEPGNYKKTTKRIEDGNKLCTDLMTLANERAEIEKNYAKALKAW